MHVNGVLHDKRTISFSTPSDGTPLVGKTLPEMQVPPALSLEEESVGSSPQMQERAALEALDGKAHFVKAWLPQEQLYLLCNVNGFLVSYVTLGALEVERLLWGAQKKQKAAAAVEEVKSDKSDKSDKTAKKGGKKAKPELTRSRHSESDLQVAEDTSAEDTSYW